MVTIHKRTGDIIETDVDDETVVVQLETGDMYSLSDTARTIWKLLDEESDEQAIIGSLADHHSVEHGQVAADLSNFRREMESAGLVESR